MATYTPNYNFYLPALGDGALNGKPWGYHINGNFTTIDSALHTLTVSVAAGGVPDYTTSENGKFLGVVGGALTWATVQALPTYSTANDGQFLGIVGGVPTWSVVEALPSYSSSNNGQVLGIVSGAPEWVNQSGGGGSDNYSTSETATNKVWINGKTIYRKVINFGALPNNTTKSVAHGIAGATWFLPPTGSARNGSGTQIPLPEAWTTAASSVALWVDGTNVNVITGQDQTAYATCYITLEYTK